MEAIGIVLLFGLIGLCYALSFMLASWILLVAAKMAGIMNRSFGRAMLATLVGGIATFIVIFFVASLSVFGTLIALGFGILVQTRIIQEIFTTSLGSAAIAATISILVNLSLIYGGMFLMSVLT